MRSIERFETGQRMSQMVIHGDLIWLAGQCGTANASTAVQTEEALAKIDACLEQAGSDKTKFLSMTIWLADIADYDEMNEVRDNRMPEGCAPARACGEARSGDSGYRVEIICIAAKPGPAWRHRSFCVRPHHRWPLHPSRLFALGISR